MDISGLSRKQRRALLKEQHQFVAALPEKLTPIPVEEFGGYRHPPVKAWRSRKYLALLFKENNPAHPAMIRLSVCRVRLGMEGRWEDGLSWDELQGIKSEVGFGDWYGVEVYPPNANVVNVANFRHLWLLPTPLTIGWFK